MSDSEASVFTLFVRVFLPKFKRRKSAQEGEEADGIDLEGGGLMKRLSRFFSGVRRSLPGFLGGSAGSSPGERTLI